MKKKRALLFGSGFYEKDFDYLKEARYDPEKDLLIGVDGGINYLEQRGISPDLIIGDLDSAKENSVERFSEVKLIQHPVQKDETDTELSISKSLEAGIKEFVFIGMIGDRVDHSLANIFLLETLVKKGYEVEMIGSKNHLIGIKGPKNLKLKLKAGTTISLISLSKKIKDLTIKGFEYPLKNYLLKRSAPGRAVSNIVKKDTQSIKFKKGILLIDIVRE